MGEKDETATATIYTTAAQRNIWYEEAEEMNMTKKQYFIAMINSGRREFGLAELRQDSDTTESSEQVAQTAAADLGLRGRVLEALNEQREDALSFEEITDAVKVDIDEEVGDILAEDDRINHHPTAGGYWRR